MSVVVVVENGSPRWLLDMFLWQVKIGRLLFAFSATRVI